MMVSTVLSPREIALTGGTGRFGTGLVAGVLKHLGDPLGRLLIDCDVANEMVARLSMPCPIVRAV
jgi:hypothetical protein